ncbi:histidine phosphatase family protein [Patescibacteria group bacterium]
MTKVYVVRHGKTDFNEQGRYMGSTDLSLNTDGKRQAEKLAKLVDRLGIEVVVVSPLKRALETAEIIKPLGQKMIIDLSFIERSVGVYEGLTRNEAEKKYPDLWKKNITRIFDDAPTNGETILEVQKRVFKGLDKIKKIYQGKNVLIVTHAFVAKVINRYFNPNISNQDFFDFVLQTAEIKEYQFK